MEISASLSAAGEVVESATALFTAQCPRARLHHPPAPGHFVRIFPEGITPSQAAQETEAEETDPFADRPLTPSLNVPEGTLYAVILSAANAGLDPGRRPSAYELEEEALRREQPHLLSLIATTFLAAPIAFLVQGRLRTGLPPAPPRLHAFVYPCTSQEITALTDLPDLPRRLLNLTAAPDPDQLLAACLRCAYLERGGDFDFLVKAGKKLTVLLRSDPERLNAILSALEP